MKTEQQRDFIKNGAKLSDKRNEEQDDLGKTNSAVIKMLQRRSADSLKTTRHTALSAEKTETENGNEYHYKIDINRAQTVRLGQSEDGKNLIVSTNPKNRESYHDDPKKSIHSEHNEISAEVGTARPKTAELKISRSEEEDFRGFADKTAEDKKIVDYGGGISSIFSTLGTTAEKETLEKTREMRKNTESEEEKAQLSRAENEAQSALITREQLSLSVKTKAESIINTLEAETETDGDGFFDILLKRKRTPEEDEEVPEDDFNNYQKEENNEGNS